MADAGVISAQYGDLSNLREQIKTANMKLSELGADTMSFTKGAEAAAWESDDFMAKFDRIRSNDDWVQTAAAALQQTEQALDQVESGFRGCVSRNVTRFA